MDINLLVLNVGNSRLAVGVFESGELKYVNRVAREQQADWRGVVDHAWAMIADADSPAVAGASVNPEAAKMLDQIVRKSTGQKVQWVGQQLDLPIKVNTDQPNETGLDRILNIAAAYEQMGKACVVVDAGTAVTVDLCNDAGEFVGGAIAPGVGMMLDSLHSHTAQLPRAAFAVPDKPVGQNTEQAILHGVYHGLRGMVKELLENYATELGTWPDLIATGGDAKTLFDNWELVHAISPDLTLYGIALAYTNHYIKHPE